MLYSYTHMDTLEFSRKKAVWLWTVSAKIML